MCLCSKKGLGRALNFFHFHQLLRHTTAPVQLFLKRLVLHYLISDITSNVWTKHITGYTLWELTTIAKVHLAAVDIFQRDPKWPANHRSQSSTAEETSTRGENPKNTHKPLNKQRATPMIPLALERHECTDWHWHRCAESVRSSSTGWMKASAQACHRVNWDETASKANAGRNAF